MSIALSPASDLETPQFLPATASVTDARVIIERATALVRAHGSDKALMSFNGNIHGVSGFGACVFGDGGSAVGTGAFVWGGKGDALGIGAVAIGGGKALGLGSIQAAAGVSDEVQKALYDYHQFVTSHCMR
jgi:hypothetical protein